MRLFGTRALLSALGCVLIVNVANQFPSLASLSEPTDAITGRADRDFDASDHVVKRGRILAGPSGERLRSASADRDLGPTLSSTKKLPSSLLHDHNNVTAVRLENGETVLEITNLPRPEKIIRTGGPSHSVDMGDGETVLEVDLPQSTTSSRSGGPTQIVTMDDGETILEMAGVMVEAISYQPES